MPVVLTNLGPDVAGPGGRIPDNRDDYETALASEPEARVYLGSGTGVAAVAWLTAELCASVAAESNIDHAQGTELGTFPQAGKWNLPGDTVIHCDADPV